MSTCDVYVHLLCHDMFKQKYSMKKHALKAWAPLSSWLFNSPGLTGSRTKMLTSFTKSDKDFFNCVSECLWNLAHGDNRPWGVVALKPRGYAAVKNKDKVFSAAYPRVFFFIQFHFITTHVNNMLYCSHVNYRLGPSRWVSVCALTRFHT